MLDPILLDAASAAGATIRLGYVAEELTWSDGTVTRFRSTSDLPHACRVPNGPGWALVGDAGLVMDPISGQGIGNALRDAELLADAVETGGHGAPLTGYQRRRDAAVAPMYDLTTDLAAFRPPGPAEREVLAALAGRQGEIDRFLGVLAGVTPPSDFLSPRGALRLVGIGGLARIAFATLRSSMPKPGPKG